MLNTNGPIVLTTGAAEFQILPSGYVQASLVKDGKRLTLDEPPSDGLAESEYVVSGGKDDSLRARLFPGHELRMLPGKWELDKRVEIPGARSRCIGEPLTNTLAFELYDSFPTLLLTSAAYRNAGNSPSILRKSSRNTED